MPKRKNPKDLDLTNENIKQYVFPKKVRAAIQRVADTDRDDEKPEDEKQ